METRTETDSLGSMAIPKGRTWGAQTQRALSHFAIGTERVPRELLRALGIVKRACAQANAELGALDERTAHAIVRAADDLVDGSLDHDLPLVIWQSGSGTQTNMNVNEVMAARASILLGAHVHPNDHVNRSQSSNDVFPTAMHVAAVERTCHHLLPALARLRATLSEKSIAFADIAKIGRTHLQDAVPLSLGQEISGWARQIEIGVTAVSSAVDAVHELAIGGTAVGTGLTAPHGFGDAAAAHIAHETGLPFVRAKNAFAAVATNDALVHLHGALRGVAVALLKIANDVRLLGSGPRAGLAEIVLPENEPGSSIMPGKVNPSQAEALCMVCMQVMGNDVVVGLAGAAGVLELNTCRPVLAFAVLQSIRLLADAAASFDVHCARGIAPNRARIAELVERSLMLVTALTPAIGYDRAAAIAQRAQRDGTTLRDAALREGVDPALFDRVVRVEAMVHPDDRSH